MPLWYMLSDVSSSRFCFGGGLFSPRLWLRILEEERVKRSACRRRKRNEAGERETVKGRGELLTVPLLHSRQCIASCGDLSSPASSTLQNTVFSNPVKVLFKW